MDLLSAIDGFVLEKSIDSSPGTIKHYSYFLTHFTEFTGNADVERVTASDVRRFFVHLRSDHNLSKRTVFDAWATLSSFYSWAERELGVTHVIRGKIPAPDYVDPEIEPYTPGQIRQMLKAAEYTAEYTARGGKLTRGKRPTALRDVAIILTLLDSGIRATELCNLKIEDYDAKNGRLHVRCGKRDKGRFVVVGMRTRKGLWKYLASRTKAKPNEPLFATKNGTHLDRFGLYRVISGLAEQCGIKDAGCHKFRHTFAIEFLRAGGNVIVLQDLLGHEKIETVLIYVKLSQRDIDGASRHSPVDSLKL